MAAKTGVGRQLWVERPQLAVSGTAAGWWPAPLWVDHQRRQVCRSSGRLHARRANGRQFEELCAGGGGHGIRFAARRNYVHHVAGQHWRAAVQRVRSVDLDRRTHAFEHIPALAVRGCPPTQWLVNGEQVTHANAGCVVSRRRLAERPLFRSANLRDRPRGAIRACNLGRLKRISRKLATAEQAFMELGTLARRLLRGTLRLACGSE